MRPRTLDEFVGQEHLLGPGRPLRLAIEAGRLDSLVLFGPPGCGKTALAHLIAARVGGALRTLNAVTAGVAEVRAVVAEAQKERRRGRPTILFVDEIHRFNKVQQSALLPDVEQGTVILIGASTANPFFAIIPALASRLRLIEMQPLDATALDRLIDRALTDPERGLGRHAVDLAPEARAHLIASAEGDARRLLNALEVGVVTTPPGPDGRIVVDLAAAEAALQRKRVAYDDEDERYDTISAFIKSLRGSDPDAALYWLAKMLVGGEDPLYIARRIVICASEDVGNADPQALGVAVDALRAFESIGMPEGRLALAQAAVYIACAPKSNAVIVGIDEAMADVRDRPSLRVPDHLRDSHYSGAAKLGRGVGYRYPHDYPGHFVPQAYLPEPRRYYRPSAEGAEKAIKQRLEGWLEALGRGTD
jgi:putative ATPase